MITIDERHPENFANDCHRKRCGKVAHEIEWTIGGQSSHHLVSHALSCFTPPLHDAVRKPRQHEASDARVLAAIFGDDRVE